MNRSRLIALLAPILVAALVVSSCSFEESPEVAAELARITGEPVRVTPEATVEVEPRPTLTSVPAPTAMPDGATTPTTTPTTTEASGSTPFVPASEGLLLFDPLHPIGPSLRADNDWLPRTIAALYFQQTRASGVVPNGLGIYVSLDDRERRSSCGDGAVGGTLGIVSLGDVGGSREAQPIDELPPNISEIHYGPDDRVALYQACRSRYQGVTLARVTPNGDFTDVQPVDKPMHLASTIWPPSWYLGPDGEVKVVIPQKGVVADTGGEGTANVIVDFETGAIERIWGSDVIAQAKLASGSTVIADGERIMVGSNALGERVVAGDNILGEWEGPSKFETSIDGVVAVTGPHGAWLLSSKPTLAGVGVRMLSAGPATGAAWEPTGAWVAITGPNGTVVHDHDGRSSRISHRPSSDPHFSAVTSTLVVVEEAPDRSEFVGFTFQPVRESSRGRVSADAVLSSGGLGELRIGMTFDEAEAVLGESFDASGESDAEDGLVVGQCVQVWPESVDGVWFIGEAMTSDVGDVEIRSITNRSRLYETPSGIRIDMTRTTVLETFPGQIEETPREAVPGSYLDFIPVDGDETTTVRFVVMGEQVEVIRVGEIDWVSGVIPCS